MEASVVSRVSDPSLPAYARWLCDVCIGILDEIRERSPIAEWREATHASLVDESSDSDDEPNDEGSTMVRWMDPDNLVTVCVNGLAQEVSGLLHMLEPRPDPDELRQEVGEYLADFLLETDARKELQRAAALMRKVHLVHRDLAELATQVRLSRPSQHVLGDLRSRLPALANAMEDWVASLQVVAEIAEQALAAPIPLKITAEFDSHVRFTELNRSCIALKTIADLLEVPTKDRLEAGLRSGGLYGPLAHIFGRMDYHALVRYGMHGPDIHGSEGALADFGNRVVRVSEEIVEELGQTVAGSPGVRSTEQSRQHLYRLIDTAATELGSLAQMYRVIGTSLMGAESGTHALLPFPETDERLQQLSSFVRDLP